MARGVHRARPDLETIQIPVADGGDGTLDVLLAAAGADHRVTLHQVHDALGGARQARLGRAADTAIVELAEAAGLRLIAVDRRDPLAASSRGAGELIAAALNTGPAPRRIVVGVGGSAGTDGGAGVAAALGARLLDASDGLLPDGGGALHRLDRVDLSGLDPRLRAIAIEVCCDTEARLLGPRGAAALFGPQKGASPGEVALLEAGLARWAMVLERDAGADPALRDVPGAGAAGGCGYGLAAVCGASLVRGAELVCDAVGLDGAIAGAALVITGEGRLDTTTETGKAPAEVARRCAAAAVPCAAVAGSIDGAAHPLFAACVAAGDGLPLEEAVRRAAELVELATVRLVAGWGQ
jgi:glycerate kinase